MLIKRDDDNSIKVAKYSNSCYHLLSEVEQSQRTFSGVFVKLKVKGVCSKSNQPLDGVK